MPEDSPGTIRLLPLSGIPAVQPSDDLPQILLSAAERELG